MKQHLELNDVITLLEGKIDAATMTNLNYEVYVNKRTSQEVAVEFLNKMSLLK